MYEQSSMTLKTLMTQLTQMVCFFYIYLSIPTFHSFFILILLSHQGRFLVLKTLCSVFLSSSMGWWIPQNSEKPSRNLSMIWCITSFVTCRSLRTRYVFCAISDPRSSTLTIEHCIFVSTGENVVQWTWPVCWRWRWRHLFVFCQNFCARSIAGEEE